MLQVKDRSAKVQGSPLCVHVFWGYARKCETVEHIMQASGAKVIDMAFAMWSQH